MLKKKFGQNFLINNDISQKIVNLQEIENKNILEIGTGNLAITKLILKKKPKKFVGVEIDEDLRNSYNPSILRYINFIDALKFDEINFFKNEKFSIISNLPFNISSILLLKWCKLQNEHNCIKEMTLMFQKELSERIIAKYNTKKFGRLSIIANAFFKISKKIEVNKENFLPRPKVDAIVLNFKPHHKNKINKVHFSNLEKITNYFFNERRKKNRKKIMKLFSKDQIEKYKLHKLYEERPENIKNEVFYKMAEII